MTRQKSEAFVRLETPIPLSIHLSGGDIVLELQGVNNQHWQVAEHETLDSLQGQTHSFDLKYHDNAIQGSLTLNRDFLSPSDESTKSSFIDFLHQVRKDQHIAICSTKDVEGSVKSNGFESIKLQPIALPELNFCDIDIHRNFLGQRFGAPLMITGMTGGVNQAKSINERLAKAAAKFQIPMGVGSQRLALDNPKHMDIFKLKDRYPDLFLIGNIGIGQLQESDHIDACKRAVEMINANCLAIHVNVLQELIQVEGDRDFRGIINKISQIVNSLDVPVLIKEVGVGLDSQSIQKLYDVGVRHFDLGGSGGTSWAHIEGLRSNHPLISRLGTTFRDFGISTCEALQAAKSLKLVGAEFSATGGIRDGLTVLKAIHLGANMCGIGLPLLKAALQDEDGPSDLLETYIAELKIAMMCCGISHLKK
ncbi:MAG: type 2 isopentenyl-diphosphate Delta-isomerase [Proteobacteria bacterium]|nr:type 2 isopentenyl-diphosphate Delta-isomerase [Pseudomonadota bacterium]